MLSFIKDIVASVYNYAIIRCSNARVKVCGGVSHTAGGKESFAGIKRRRLLEEGLQGHFSLESLRGGMSQKNLP
jgi:hypothetical protein